MVAVKRAFVARDGGDEFAVLVEVSAGEPRSTAGRLEACLRDPVRLIATASGSARGVRLSARLGIAVSRGGTVDEVLAAADAAMYAAKGGRRS